MVVQFVNLLADAQQHFGRVLALAHHHNAVDDVVHIVLTDQALRRELAHAHLGHIAHQHGGTLAFCHHHAFNVGAAPEAAQRAHQVLLPALCDGPATSVAVGALKGAEKLRQRNLAVT